MAFVCGNSLLKTRIKCSQFFRSIWKMADQQCNRNFYSNNRIPANNNARRSELLLADQILVFSNWNLRSYAKKVRGDKSSKRKIILTDEEMMEVVNVPEYRERLQAIINKLKADFVAHLSLRTSVGSIDSLPIQIENDEFPLNELAQISRKNPNLIAINLSGFPEGLKPVLQAINESGLGLNPQQEGTMIYLPVPKVTREFRETLSKNAKMLFNKAKDEIRDVQNSFIKKAKMQTELPKDLVFSTTQQVTAIAEEFALEAEKILKAKQKDLLGND